MGSYIKELDQIDVERILDQRERQRCLESFNAYDKNGSKRLEKEELQKVLEEMGQNPTEEAMIQMINEVDHTGEGAICYEDFCKVVALQKLNQQKADQQDILLAFLALGGDVEKNQSINREKFISVIKDEFNLTIDIRRLLKELDLDGDEDVDYEEFKNLLLD